jgi:hypothetical protein
MGSFSKVSQAFGDRGEIRNIDHSGGDEERQRLGVDMVSVGGPVVCLVSVSDWNVGLANIRPLLQNWADHPFVLDIGAESHFPAVEGF